MAPLPFLNFSHFIGGSLVSLRINRKRHLVPHHPQRTLMMHACKARQCRRLELRSVAYVRHYRARLAWQPPHAASVLAVNAALALQKTVVVEAKLYRAGPTCRMKLAAPGTCAGVTF